MKIPLLVCAATLSLVSIGAAQETPQYEVFVGGSYLRVHASGAELTQLLNLPAISYQPHNINLNLYGWDGSLTENKNRWIGGEFDVSGFYGSPNSSFLYPASELVSPSPNFAKQVPIITRYQTYMVGPRFTWRKGGRVVFFAHLPIGVAYANASLSQSAVIAPDFETLPSGTIKGSTGLALSPGVGIDVRLNPRVTFRPVQMDYLITHVFGERQDNVRFAAGLDFTFGEK
jgi:hypothetical protein